MQVTSICERANFSNQSLSNPFEIWYASKPEMYHPEFQTKEDVENYFTQIAAGSSENDYMVIWKNQENKFFLSVDWGNFFNLKIIIEHNYPLHQELKLDEDGKVIYNDQSYSNIEVCYQAYVEQKKVQKDISTTLSKMKMMSKQSFQATKRTSNSEEVEMEDRQANFTHLKVIGKGITLCLNHKGSLQNVNQQLWPLFNEEHLEFEKGSFTQSSEKETWESTAKVVSFSSVHFDSIEAIDSALSNFPCLEHLIFKSSEIKLRNIITTQSLEIAAIATSTKNELIGRLKRIHPKLRSIDFAPFLFFSPTNPTNQPYKIEENIVDLHKDFISKIDLDAFLKDWGCIPFLNLQGVSFDNLEALKNECAKMPQAEHLVLSKGQIQIDIECPYSEELSHKIANDSLVEITYQLRQRCSKLKQIYFSNFILSFKEKNSGDIYLYDLENRLVDLSRLGPRIHMEQRYWVQQLIKEAKKLKLYQEGIKNESQALSYLKLNSKQAVIWPGNFSLYLSIAQKHNAIHQILKIDLKSGKISIKEINRSFDSLEEVLKFYSF